MVESNYTTILSPAYVYIYIMYICLFIFIYYIYNIHDPTLFLVLHPFPGIRFFFLLGVSRLEFRAFVVSGSAKRMFWGFLKGAGLKEGSLRMAHFCGGFTMFYRAFWLLKMVMFHIFSRAIGSSKIRESPIENEDNI